MHAVRPARLALAKPRLSPMVDVNVIRKAELHCHSDNLLDPAMVEEFTGAGHELGIEPDELARRYPFDSVDRWVREYADYIAPHLQPAAKWIPLVIERHVERLKAQRVAYAELFVSDLLGAFEQDDALVEAFQELRRRVDGAAGSELRVEFVVCVGRGPEEKLERSVPKIRALSEAGVVCGVALAGREAEYPVRPLQRIFDQFRGMGLGIEIHAGEFAGPQSVWDALQYGAPDRLGHAVAAFEDESLVQTLLERQIHVEFCPTSNMRLGVVRRIEQHPLGVAREVGLEFSINTDDPGPFECTLTSELELVQRTFGFTAEDFERVFQSALRAGFADAPATAPPTSADGTG